jgi:hypothetical protein
VIVEAETLFRGSAGKAAGELTAGARGWVETNPTAYRELAQRHSAGVAPVD